MALGNVHITPQLVQAVRDAVDVVAVAGEHTRLRKAGREYEGLCPLHKEKTPSFSVDPVKGLFYCFGCGAGGDAIRLHMLTSGDDFPGAIETLALRHGIPLPRRSERRSGGPAERDLSGALALAQEFFVDQLQGSAGARRYLEERRMAPELVERYGLGYAPDGWQGLHDALTPRISAADLQAAGLLAKSEKSGRLYDRFRHRLMFPIKSASGQIVGFGGRTLGDDKAKYINTAETARFHKSRLLYGLYEAKRTMRDNGRALLVEGYFDVLGAVASGVDGVVAGMGTALTEDQAKILARYVDEVVLGYDGDAAGDNAAKKALPLLLAHKLAVRRARFGAGQDPDSLRLAEGPEAVAAAVAEAEDAVRQEIAASIPEGVHYRPAEQQRSADRIGELLGTIPDAIVRRGYAQAAARRLGVPLDRLMGRSRSREEAPRQDPTHRMEDTALARLVSAAASSGADQVPALDDLPPSEVFFDEACRHLYEVFVAIFRDEGSPPDPASLLATLPAGSPETERLARILGEMEGPSEHQAGPEEGGQRFGLGETLARLEHRWLKSRERELAAALQEAQRRGQDPEVLRLLEKKNQITRRLHLGRSL